MKVFIAADHNGFDFKESLKKWLIKKGIEVVDAGNTTHDPADDYPDYVSVLAKGIESNPDALGIVLCGSGVGVDIAANKYSNLRSGLGFDTDQVRASKADDAINVLALPASYISEQQAKEMVETFINTPIDQADRHVRRRKKVSEIR